MQSQGRITVQITGYVDNSVAGRESLDGDGDRLGRGMFLGAFEQFAFSTGSVGVSDG
jgi:hypothetical protein